MQVESLGQEDSLEAGMATRILAWKIPWIKGHGRLQSIVSQRVKHDWSNLALTYAHTNEIHMCKQELTQGINTRVHKKLMVSLSCSSLLLSPKHSGSLWFQFLVLLPEITFFHFPFSLSCIGEGNGNPLQCSCLENPRDGGAWWASVYGAAQSWTRLKLLSSSSSSSSRCYI